jgi:hypothetical protein
MNKNMAANTCAAQRQQGTTRVKFPRSTIFNKPANTTRCVSLYSRHDDTASLKKIKTRSRQPLCASITQSAHNPKIDCHSSQINTTQHTKSKQTHTQKKSERNVQRQQQTPRVLCSLAQPVSQSHTITETPLPIPWTGKKKDDAGWLSPHADVAKFSFYLIFEI